MSRIRSSNVPRPFPMYVLVIRTMGAWRDDSARALPVVRSPTRAPAKARAPALRSGPAATQADGLESFFDRPVAARHCGPGQGDLRPQLVQHRARGAHEPVLGDLVAVAREGVHDPVAHREHLAV